MADSRDSQIPRDTRIPCVGAIVVDDDGRLLLIRRAHPPAQGLWSIPGGRVEAGESSEEAVIRELHEETGLRGEIVREVGTIEREAPSGGTYVIRDYLVAVDGDTRPRAADDALDARWFGRSELDEVETSEGLVEILTGWKVIPNT